MGHEQKSAKTFDSYLINAMYSSAFSVLSSRDPVQVINNSISTVRKKIFDSQHLSQQLIKQIFITENFGTPDFGLFLM